MTDYDAFVVRRPPLVVQGLVSWWAWARWCHRLSGKATYPAETEDAMDTADTPLSAAAALTSPVLLPVVCWVHIMAVHSMSVFSSRVKQTLCIALAEHCCAMAAVDVLVLLAAEYALPTQPNAVWAIAVYLSVYFLWHMQQCTAEAVGATLSVYALLATTACAGGVCLLMYTAASEALARSADGVALGDHFVGLMAAESTHALLALLLSV